MDTQDDNEIPIQGYLNDPVLLPKLCAGSIDDMADHERLLTLENVRDVSGLDADALATLIRTGLFPKPYETRGARRKVWKMSDVQCWVAQNVT